MNPVSNSLKKIKKFFNSLPKNDIFALKIGVVFLFALIIGTTAWIFYWKYLFKPAANVVVQNKKPIAVHKIIKPQQVQSPPATNSSSNPGKITTQVRPKPTEVVVPSPQSSVDNLTPVSVPAATGSSSTPTTTQPTTQSTVTYTSLNWSGYMASGGKFTGVSGSWEVPQISGNGVSASADAAWVGIGGVSSGDLIQAGTFGNVTASGQVTYSAFYEMLPVAAQFVPSFNVSAGDVIRVSINENSPGQWVININDATSGSDYSNIFTYTSTNSTAEWIEEDPSYGNGNLVPLDHFGSVVFSGAQATEDASQMNLLTSQAATIILVDRSGKRIAVPTPISSSGTAFTVNQVN